jgi:acyl-[acyl-carrier-protein]-phospholipid O-acyltransferase / long-chain-fatty-acid--[acyl-carrier-protein] ligase
MPSVSNTTKAPQAVQDANSESWLLRKNEFRPLHRGFVRTARRHPFLFAMGDQRAPKVTFGSALTKTIFLARRLRPHWENQKMVGILLPPSVAGALVNFAALLMGKVPVNLNYTVSDDVLASCIQQCGIQTVVTSQLFLDKVKLAIPCATLKLEEVAANPGAIEKLSALFATWAMPVGMLEKYLGREKKCSMDDLATVIFSSGSTGEPKGVMLTHFNIASNVEQICQVFTFKPQDRFLGILPFFHSFGFTATLMLTATSAIGVVYHPNPRDAKVIGELVRNYQVSFVVSTPTFLQMYYRACQSDDFRSVRIILTGAEKLPERLAAAFEQKFGVRPMEGYGCTECAPAVAANHPDVVEDNARKVNHKIGSIGRPMPGISVKIVDPDNMEPLGLNKPGLLLVKGPNIMKGYLGKPQQTAEVLRDGWYVTGDIAAQDEDGFLFITDRLSRFSKIGGEMVPHIKVEEKLHQLAGLTDQTFAVTGVPDPKKGERLVVLHTLPEDQLQPLLARLQEIDLPNLWIPRPNQFFHLESLPVLGTGKLDLRQIRQVASEKALPPSE